MSKTISMCQGKGSLSHNNREFTAKNIDPSRTPDNIIFKQQDLGEAYHQMFDKAVERYNAKQKRNDRKINDYFQHLFNREPSKSVITGANKQKSFYEDLVQIGTKDDCGDKWVETDRLYTKWNGEPMQNGTPYFWLGEFCEKHDLPFYGLHSFRHLFCSMLVNNGVDIATVSGAMGHSCISTTVNTSKGHTQPPSAIFDTNTKVQQTKRIAEP